MDKDFDKWNEIKKELNRTNNEPILFPKEGEVWMCSIGKNIGFEQNGAGDSFSRPVLIVKKFNNRMFWIVPLSTKQKPFDFYYNFIDPKNLKVAAILAQLRLVSIKRFRRNLYSMDQENFAAVRTKLGKWFI